MKPTFVIVMGVSGSGKSTIGQGLAEQCDWPFYDADDFHPPANVAKMASGQALDDRDRWPWLDRLHELIETHHAEQKSGVLACSALKDTYRQRLIGDLEGYLSFAYLEGDFSLIAERMAKRANHYMPPSLLQSQFATLEVPQDAIRLDIAQSPADIIAALKKALKFP